MNKSTAVFNGLYFEHFGIHPITASLYGHNSSEIIEVELVIVDDQSRPPVNESNMDIDYWGWWDEERQKFTLIYAKYFLLNMCFPYGIKAYEDKKEGKAYRLQVKSLSNISN